MNGTRGNSTNPHRVSLHGDQTRRTSGACVRDVESERPNLDRATCTGKDHDRGKTVRIADWPRLAACARDGGAFAWAPQGM